MLINYADAIVAAFAVAAVSMTVARSSALRPIRESFLQTHPRTIGKLLSCPYCLSHWATVFVIPWLGPADLYSAVVAFFAVIAASAVITGFAIRLLHMGQDEFEDLRDDLEQHREWLDATDKELDLVRNDFYQAREFIRELSESDQKKAPATELNIEVHEPESPVQIDASLEAIRAQAREAGRNEYAHR